MNFVVHHILTCLIFLPAAGALCVRWAKRLRIPPRWAGLTVTLLSFAVALSLLFFFDRHGPPGQPPTYAYRDIDHHSGVVQLVQHFGPGPILAIQYKVGVDGLSLPLVLLTTFICAIACAASWKIQGQNPRFLVHLLMFEACVLGTLLAMDLVFFFLFFQGALFPLYGLLGSSGEGSIDIGGDGRENAKNANFVLHMLGGGVALGIVLIAVVWQTGSFDLIELPALLRERRATGHVHQQTVLFLLTMLAFLVRLPIVPLHTWWVDLHARLSGTVSLLLAALVPAMSGYGIFRIAYPLFPEAAATLWLWFAVLAITSVIHSSLCALAEKDLSRQGGFLSIAQLGLIVLGAAVLTPIGMSAALFILVSHGMVFGLLLYLIATLRERSGQQDLSRLGGVAARAPVLAGFAAVAFLAVLGMPPLSNFVGDFLVITGLVSRTKSGAAILADGHVGPGQVYAIAGLLCVSLVIVAGAVLSTFQRVFIDADRAGASELVDVDSHHVLVLTVLLVAMVLLGVLPRAMNFNLTQATVDSLYPIRHLAHR